MAYLKLEISGNTSFGGYLSMDGGKAIKVEDEMFYEIPSGRHTFVVHSASNASRSYAKFQAGLYNNTSSSGAILDAIERHQIQKGLGDSWEFEVDLDDDELLRICITSSGDQIVDDPAYAIQQLDDEDLAALEEMFAEVRAEQERIANTPRRSWKMILIGLAIAAFSVFGVYQVQIGGVQTDDPMVTTIGFVVIALIGLLVFFLGARKKVRR